MMGDFKMMSCNDKACRGFGEDYKEFLSVAKTERECVGYFENEAKKLGYRNLETIIAEGGSLTFGDKVYIKGMEKCILLFRIGKDLMDGINIVASHIDSPRLDLKQNPLYADSDLFYLDTHYYGGIKKYQWVALPLALHGVVMKNNGEKVVINIGEKDEDPVLYISDLLPHLAAEQMVKSGQKVVEGEKLDVLIGNQPENGEKGDSKDATERILPLLKEYYQIEKEDFFSAELEIVPAGKARDCGLDRSLIVGYGHDDRSCAYAAFRAFCDAAEGDKTLCCMLMDKEEIGSNGATGMQSYFYENAVNELLYLTGKASTVAQGRVMRRSRVLSADVSAAYDPCYGEVFDKRNCAYLGKGPVFNKYTGARGKSGSNDANAEYLAVIRKILHDDDVTFQSAELGKVDAGGGGTIAYMAARYCMEVVDCGIAVLSMHAPFEVISKADLYETFRCYRTFFEKA